MPTAARKGFDPIVSEPAVMESVHSWLTETVFSPHCVCTFLLAMIYPCYVSDYLSPNHDVIDAIIIVTLRTTTAMTMAMAAIAAIRGEAQIPGLLLPQWNGWQGHVIS